jgi:hypothetical protein
MSFHRVYFRAGVGVPQSDGVVIGAGSDGFSVRAECDGIDGTSMSFHRVYFRAGVGVPQSDGVVIGAGSDGFSVRAECDGMNRTLTTYVFQKIRQVFNFFSLRHQGREGLCGKDGGPREKKMETYA